MPHFRGFPVHTDHGKSFMRQEANGSVLLYVGDWATNDVYVYDYSNGKSVGTLTGFDEPYGICTDKNADVYITNFGAGDAVEYKYGGTTAVKTFTTGGEPIGCSVSAAGAVAVTSFDPGEVTIYPKGKTTNESTYSNSSCVYQWTMGYDAKGDLVGVGEYSSIDVCALLARSKSETTLTTSGITIGFPGGTTWDGKYIALGDQEAGGTYQTGVWPSTISGSTIAAAESEIVFSDTCYGDYTDDVNPFFAGATTKSTERAATMVGPNLWCVDAGSGKVDYWNYPAGGSPFGNLAAPPAEPYGAAAPKAEPTSGAKAKVILSFAGGRKGATPNTTLISDSSGNQYGTTASGGASSDGTVFELVSKGKNYTEKVLHSFGGPDGANPEGALLLTASGIIYGTTAEGGDSSCQCGVVFSLTPVKGGYKYSTLYKFQGASDGADPMAGLTAGSSGKMYGTTENGGNSSCTNGCGTIFQYDPTLGYAQDVQLDLSAGVFPVASLTVIACGSSCGSVALAGVASQGGSGGGCTGGCGTIFEADKIGSTWTVNAAYSFGSQSGDGSDPESPVAQVEEYPPAFAGATKSGGDASCNCGTVYYSSRPTSGSWHETVLHQFTLGTSDGQYPIGGLVVDSSGALLGVTYAGGKTDAGAAFAVTYSGSGSSAGESVIYNYATATGSAPLAGFALAASGKTDRLFGTASTGGTHGHGSALIITHEQGGGRQAHWPQP
jgi:hypothetical protein